MYGAINRFILLPIFLSPVFPNGRKKKKERNGEGKKRERVSLVIQRVVEKKKGISDAIETALTSTL